MTHRLSVVVPAYDEGPRIGDTVRTLRSVLGGLDLEIVVVDAPGEGFNDPTPAAPVGGNTGTTRGQQRLKAFEYAASIWSARLRSAVRTDAPSPSRKAA